MHMRLLDFLIRLAAALLMGAAVGFERQWRQRMAGTRTTALVAAGASAFVMCAFMVPTQSEAQIVSYVVSGVGFLGAGVIFKDAGGVRGLNTAATIWCSAAIGAISGLGNAPAALILTGAVLATNVVLRPLAYRLSPTPASDAGADQELTYVCELICRPEDEARMRALVVQGVAQSALILTGLRSEDIEGTNRLKITAQVQGIGRQNSALEQLVSRLSLEPGVSSVSWAVRGESLE